MIVAGVLLGLILSPAVLGNLAPSTYNRLFVGGENVRQQIMSYQQTQQQDIQKKIKDIQSSDASKAAIAELRQRLLAGSGDAAKLKFQLATARAEHFAMLIGRMNALVMALLAIMVLEVVVSPEAKAGRAVIVPRAVNRLITIRYALLALWIALGIARPALLARTPFIFVVLLIGVALLVAFIPLGGRGPQSASAAHSPPA